MVYKLELMATAGAVFGSTIACVLLVVTFGVGADELELVADC